MSRAAIALLTLVFALPVWAGGPLAVGGPNLGTEGQPFTWDLAAGPIQYRTDGGPLSRRGTTIVVDQAAGISRVQAMFQAWEDIHTSAVAFNRAGGVQQIADGDVSNLTEFSSAATSCDNGAQSPIVFDADGSIFEAVTGDSLVIGFAGPCEPPAGSSRIHTGLAALNGKFIDGVDMGDNFELTAQEFDQAFVHEFGHFLGLDHSQINVDVFELGFPCDADTLRGLPTMFPILICQARVSESLSVIGPDDAAWISKLYPSATFAASYGTIRGKIFFSDGITQAQGVNVIARRVDNPATPEDESRREAYSVVSGYLFTGNPGQSVSCLNGICTNDGGSPFGSRSGTLYGEFEIAVQPGDYTLQVESVDSGFDGGSSVGPLDPPIANPGLNEWWSQVEFEADDPDDLSLITVVAGSSVTRNIVLNGTFLRFDESEDEASLHVPTLRRGGGSPIRGAR
jgi:hypothetical protein